MDWILFETNLKRSRVNDETIEFIKLLVEKSDKIYSAIVEGNKYNEIENDIELIFEYSFDKRRIVSEVVSSELFKLAQVSNDICDKITKIMETGNIYKRHIIICTLNSGYKFENKFVEKIIYMAIKDKNKKIKIMGAYKANQCGLYNFVNIIKDEIEKTNDDSMKEALEFHCSFLTKGYLIDKSEKGTWIYVDNGTQASKIPNEISTEEDIHKYIITNYKDDERIKYLYFRDQK